MISNKKIIEKMIEAVRAKLGTNLKRVILYGSMARFDNTDESDFDCIAVVEEISSDLYEFIKLVLKYLPIASCNIYSIFS